MTNIRWLIWKASDNVWVSLSHFLLKNTKQTHLVSSCQESYLDWSGHEIQYYLMGPETHWGYSVPFLPISRIECLGMRYKTI